VVAREWQWCLKDHKLDNKMDEVLDIEKEINSLKESHSPSYSRGLIRLAKKVLQNEDELRRILVIASNIHDPYYGAYTLASCAKEMQNSKIEGYSQVFNKSLALIEKVSPEWRRVEILEFVISKMGQTRSYKFDEIFTLYNTIESPDLKNDITRKLIREFIKTGFNDFNFLIKLGKDVKNKVNIIKYIANELQRFGSMDFSKLEDVIINLDDPVYEIKSWSYLGFKSENIKKGSGVKYFDIAFSEIDKISDNDEKLEVLKYIADISIKANIFNFDNLISKDIGFKDIYYEAKYLIHLAGTIAKSDTEKAINLFNLILEKIEDIKDLKKKIKILLNIGIGLKKAGSDKANTVFNSIEQLLNEFSEDERNFFEKKLESIKNKIDTSSTDKNIVVKNSLQSGDIKNLDNPLLGLYNTYEKKLGQSHIRTIARAAPLCFAYNLDLGIFNYPIKNSNELIKKIIEDTSLGEGGKLLFNLSKSKRLVVLNEINKEELGIIVATTPNPNPDKKIEIENIVTLPEKKCFLIGIGKLGLPKTVLDKADYHLDFTNKEVSLETCTAIGILAYILGTINENK
jgi:hypothetical protein